MRLNALRFLIVASIGATVGSLHAESELKAEATTDGECFTHNVFQHIFTTANINDCLTEAKNRRLTKGLDGKYIVHKQNDTVFRESIEKAPQISETTNAAYVRSEQNHDMTKIKNIRSRSPFAKAQALETLDGYQTVSPAEQ